MELAGSIVFPDLRVSGGLSRAEVVKDHHARQGMCPGKTKALMDTSPTSHDPVIPALLLMFTGHVQEELG